MQNDKECEYGALLEPIIPAQDVSNDLPEGFEAMSSLLEYVIFSMLSLNQQPVSLARVVGQLRRAYDRRERPDDSPG
jgi:hypothetical protein